MTDPATILAEARRAAHTNVCCVQDMNGNLHRAKGTDVAHAAIDRLARVAGLVGQLSQVDKTDWMERDRLMSELEKEVGDGL